MTLPIHTFEFDDCDGVQFPALTPLRQPNEDLGACLARLIERYLWDPALIVREAVARDHDPLPSVGGVYFLVLGNRIVYVGFSRGLSNRLNQHREGGMQFDRFWCFGGMPEVFATEIEAIYIHAIKPIFNADFPPLADDLQRVLDDILCGNRRYTYT